MKKSSITRVFPEIVITALVVGPILWAAALALTAPPAFMADRPMQESLTLQVQNVTRSNGFYNVSLAITNTSDQAIKIVKVRIGDLTNSYSPYPLTDMTGAAVYYDDAQLSDANAMRCNINGGSTLQVNFIFAVANHSPGTVAVTVYTPNTMYYEEAALPP